MGKSVLVLVLLFAGGYCQDATTESRVVNTAQGPVRGYRASDGDYFTFLGIPYATEPTGRDKYKAPLPPPTWQETFEANDFSVCPQSPFQDFTWDVTIGGDNCLQAHVFVPITNVTNLPVVVYFHGGGFYLGAGMLLQPNSMVPYANVIYVNFNYRVGIHGFLCLGTEQIPGNAGMKDMVALLRWVNLNIASFGGNPNDVTIHGSSAGSASVELLMVSPIARGLFHKVIPESASFLSPFGQQTDPFQTAKTLAGMYGFNSDDVYELEDFFTSLTIDEISSSVFQEMHINSTITTVPCVERSIPGVQSFLTESAYSMLKRGDFARVPYLVGFAEHEGLMFLPDFPQWSQQMNAAFTSAVPGNLALSVEEKEAVANLAKGFYFGSQNVTEQTIQTFVDYFSDTFFNYPAERAVKLMAEAGSNNIYFYVFAYYNEDLHGYPVPDSSVIVYGANHCGQTMELLNPRGLITDGIISEENLRVRNSLRQLWTNFIWTGNPIPEATAEYPQGWPTATANGAPYMRIDNNSYVSSDPLFANRMAFWEGIYDRYYREPIPPPEHAERNTGCRLFGGAFTVILSIVFGLVFY